MKLVVDTNVFISGVFFSGPPHKILDAWRRCVVEIVASPSILEEYRAVGKELADEYSGVSLAPWLQLLMIHATVIDAPTLPRQVCTDPDDDMFLACALASGTKFIVSGDKALLRASGYKGIETLTPRQFVDRYL